MGADIGEREPLIAKSQPSGPVRAANDPARKGTKWRPGYHIFPFFARNPNRKGKIGQYADVIENTSALRKDMMKSNTITMQMLTLDFNDIDVERAYQYDYADRGLIPARVALVVGFFLYLLMSIVDEEEINQFPSMTRVMETRFCISGPAFFMAFLFTFFDDIKRQFQSATCYCLLLSGLGHVYVATVEGDDFYPALFLFLMYYCTVSRVRFMYAIFMCFAVVLTYHTAEYDRKADYKIVEHFMFLALSVIILSIASYNMEVHSRKDFLMALALFKAQEKAKTVLRGILPEEIIHKLEKKGGGDLAIAEHFEYATLLFADIVGFTAYSSTHTAEEVVDMLNQLFVDFDEVATELGLEKIKTIGDCYMIAGGLPVRIEDHVERIAMFAVRMKHIVTSRWISQSINVRIGMHTGNVIAGIIGRTKFLYDVWGDTVNVASRMESNGEPARIHTTETMAAILEGHPLFKVELHGDITIKGKGSMKTYWVDETQAPENIVATYTKPAPVPCVQADQDAYNALPAAQRWDSAHTRLKRQLQGRYGDE